MKKKYKVLLILYVLGLIGGALQIYGFVIDPFSTSVWDLFGPISALLRFIPFMLALLFWSMEEKCTKKMKRFYSIVFLIATVLLVFVMKDEVAECIEEIEFFIK